MITISWLLQKFRKFSVSKQSHISEMERYDLQKLNSVEVEKCKVNISNRVR
jgi:hypothetical protein